MNRHRMISLVVLAIAAVATRAAAIDLTGTWAPASASGQLRCKYVRGDGTGSDSAVSFQLRATQTADRLALASDGELVPFFICPGGIVQHNAGWVVSNADPGRGDALATSCDADIGVSQAVLFSKAKTYGPDAEGVTGSAKVTIMYTETACVVTCKGKFKRTSTTDPTVPVCP